jgi:hypothetical protein
MLGKEHFRNLALMARRISANMISRDIADRLEAIGRDFDHQAEEAPDTDASDLVVLPDVRAQGTIKLR